MLCFMWATRSALLSIEPSFCSSRFTSKAMSEVSCFTTSGSMAVMRARRWRRTWSPAENMCLRGEPESPGFHIMYLAAALWCSSEPPPRWTPRVLFLTPPSWPPTCPGIGTPVAFAMASLRSLPSAARAACSALLAACLAAMLAACLAVLPGFTVPVSASRYLPKLWVGASEEGAKKAQPSDRVV